jgi:hypothetical protein
MASYIYDGTRRPTVTRIATSLRSELGLALACIALLAISVVTLPRQQLLLVPGAPHAPWCLPDQSPSFEFGFAALNQATGGVMGAPTECEHGTTESNGDTSQKTTTGLATYSWCTNTPSFARGQERWILTADGLEHWIGGPDSPRSLRIVRAPDLRYPCLG